MRTISIRAAASLMLVAALAAAPAVGVRAADNGKKGDAAVCMGDFGTSVRFEKSPSAAAKKALAAEKLVVVLHVSGDFEDSGLT
jgi:hypothetical protein